mgnify:CR=1 FL=1
MVQLCCESVLLTPGSALSALSSLLRSRSESVASSSLSLLLSLLQLLLSFCHSSSSSWELFSFASIDARRNSILLL